MDKLTMIALPGIEKDLIPLWTWKEGKARAKGWAQRDFSQLNWAAEFTDYSRADKEFQRPPPDAYGVRGDTYFIIDIDAKGDADKAERLLAQLYVLGLDTNTYTVKTKSHGLHLYYLNPGYDVKTQAAWLPSIDIRGHGGYVVGPDISLIEWVEGTYVVINDSPPIDCTLDPRVNYSSDTHAGLPTLESMGDTPGGESVVISITEMLETRKIEAGQRDAALLRLSGYFVAKGLDDTQIEIEFNKFDFESLPGDEISLDMLMDKVERDRDKNVDVMAGALERFVFLESSQIVMDLYNGAAIPMGNLRYSYPAKMWGETAAGKPKQEYVAHLWVDHPDRVNAWDVGYKPTSDTLYMDNAVRYVNTYHPSLVVPWDEPVQWDDPYLAEYRMVIDNLCNNNSLTRDLLMSARAAKVQDLTWTPCWGFVIISEEKRVGKDLQLKMFAPLIARAGTGFSIASRQELSDGRNTHLKESMVTLVNEPEGINDSSAREGIKLLFSETEAAIKPLYAPRSESRQLYRIPEMHSNFADIADLARGNKRFAPIVCKNGALDTSIYLTIYNKLGNKTNNKLLRMIKRMLLDWDIHPDINLLTAPDMPDGILAEYLSKGNEFVSIITAIKEGETILISDIQTNQSLLLAIHTYTDARNVEATRVLRALVKGGHVKELIRKRNVPIVTYHKSSFEASDTQKIELTMSDGGMKTYFTIRNHDTHSLDIHNGNTNKYIRQHFFNTSSWKDASWE